MIYSFKRPYAVRGGRLLDCTLPTVGWRVDSGPEAGYPLLKAPMVMKEVNRVPVEKRTTATVYDRAVLEAAGRFADARILGREQSGNGGGNVR